TRLAPASLILFTLLRAAPSTLFPYTTLFRSKKNETSVSFAGQGIQTFFHIRKVDGSTHGHPVRLVTETRAERGRPAWQDEEGPRSEEHTSELQSRFDLVCRLLLEKKKKTNIV